MELESLNWVELGDLLHPLLERLTLLLQPVSFEGLLNETYVGHKVRRQLAIYPDESGNDFVD